MQLFQIFYAWFLASEMKFHGNHSMVCRSLWVLLQMNTTTRPMTRLFYEYYSDSIHTQLWIYTHKTFFIGLFYWHIHMPCEFNLLALSIYWFFIVYSFSMLLLFVDCRYVTVSEDLKLTIALFVFLCIFLYQIKFQKMCNF